jgi:hypothetical protein
VGTVTVMLRVLEGLSAAVESEDDQIREEAVLQFSMLLERSNLADSLALGEREADFYRSMLAPHLATVTLAAHEQAEVVTRLARLVADGRGTSSMLWAIGKAAPEAGIGPLLRLLCTHSSMFDEEMAYQALVALENFLGASVTAGVERELQASNPAAVVQVMSGATNPRLAERARAVLAKLERLEVRR